MADLEIDGSPTDTHTDISSVPPREDEMERLQLERRQNVRPLTVAKLFVHHTKKTCFIACLIPILAIALIVATKSFSIDDPAGPEYFVRNDVRTRLHDGRLAARDDFPYRGEDDSDSEPLTQQETALDKGISILMRGKNAQTQQIATLENFGSVDNVLTPEAFALHKQAEDEILLHQNYSLFCLHDPNQLDCDGNPRTCVLPRSYLNHPKLYGRVVDDIPCDRRPGHDPVSDKDFNDFLNDMFGQDKYNMKIFFDSNISATNRKAWAAQSSIYIGVPFPGFSSTDDNESKQDDMYVEWGNDVIEPVNDLSTSSHNLYAISQLLSNSLFDDIVLRDLSFSILAIILVFVVMWTHMSSLFLAAVAMLQIILSFPLAYVVYRLVLRQLYFAALQILTVFLVLGIGADDVFVFTDAWKQAAVELGPGVDLITRMSWTYRRAVRAMTVTSLTTAAAFFVNAASPIMPISTLGVWAGVLIILLYALVITLYPCGIIIWHRFWRPRLFVRGFKTPPPEDIEREVATPLWHRFLPKSRRPVVKVSAIGEYRRLERFFRDPWFNIIHKMRFILIAIAVILVAIAIWLASGLKPPEVEEDFLPKDHPVQVAFDTLEDGFPRSEADQQLRIAVTWGIRDVDRTGTSRYDVQEIGTPVFDESFDLTRAAVQEHILETCSFFGDQEDIIFQQNTGIVPVECWIKDFSNWRALNKSKSSFEDYSSQEALIAELIEFGEFVDPKNGTKPYIEYLQDQHVAFNSSRVVFAEVRFVGSTEIEVPERIMWPVYLKWQDELEKLNERAPEGAENAIATAGPSWLWQITQRTLVDSMFTGVGVMLVVALVVLVVATMNLVVAILATLSIGGVAAMLLGVIRLLGWPLGITESVGIVIAVGYSFDGIAHVATAYVESGSSERLARTRHALTDLGISVLFGALTTLLAGLCLFPGIIVFFVKFAGLIVSTIILSVIWSLGFFPALLMVVGPEGKFGSLWALFTRLRRKSDIEDPQVNAKSVEK